MADRRGKYIIVGIFALALLAAVSAWWYRYTQTRQAAKFWGGAAAETILKAEEIELLTLKPDPSAVAGPATITDNGTLYHVTSATSVTQTRGMLNARNALVSDGSLSFSTPALPETTWQYALRFHGSSGDVTVLLNLDRGRAKALGHPGTVGIEPIAEGFRILFHEALDSSAPVTSP